MAGKRILFYTETFIPHTETFVYADIIGMSAANEVKALCLERANLDKFPFEQVETLPYHRPWLRQKVWNRLYSHNLYCNYFNRPFAKALNGAVQAFQPDIIHCFFGPAGLQLVDNLAAKHIPVVINFLGYDASTELKGSPIYRKRIRSILKRPYVFPTANAEALLGYMKAHGVSSAHSRKIFLGVDAAFFKRATPPPAQPPFCFLQVAGFREKKGHTYTLQAFQRFLADKNPEHFKLMFVGGGGLEAELKAQAQALGISQQVVFAGWESKNQVRSALEQAHCFIHPSITPENGDKEGIPVAITEAMAMELPVIATHHSGIPELVTHGQHGLLVEEKDIEAYVAAMNKMLDWGLLPKNREHIVNHFSQERRLQTLQSFYDYALTVIAKSPFSPSRS